MEMPTVNEPVADAGHVVAVHMMPRRCAARAAVVSRPGGRRRTAQGRDGIAEMVSMRALECLVIIVEQDSLTQAAAVLHMSQPALSHQIAAIERELGAHHDRRGLTAMKLIERAGLTHRRSRLGDRAVVDQCLDHVPQGRARPPVLTAVSEL